MKNGQTYSKYLAVFAPKDFEVRLTISDRCA